MKRDDGYFKHLILIYFFVCLFFFFCFAALAVVSTIFCNLAQNNTLGDQSKLQLLHENPFKKSAFTFCKGTFGGVKGKEFICVMFMDGSLKFFEQDGISQDCVLPGSRSIPSSFIYIPRTDCFIILAPNWDLECYRCVYH